MKPDKKKVVIGLSGGVDSATAVLLLQEKGYDVTGLYFDIVPEDMPSEKNHAEKNGPHSGRMQAETAARQLGINFIYRNVADVFDKIVIGNFCSEYAGGRTPNPCIVCNPAIKFQTLLDAADEVGAYYVATGHYADTYHDETTDTWYIKRAASEKKDQSYMLYRLGQEVISRLLLPLNHMEDKETVRAIAKERALKNADARDSQEICFIDETEHYRDFLARRGITSPEGDFVDSEGNVLGEHQGILNYTIGQRKGLGIALGKPAFVTEIDAENNRVVLGDNADLFRTEVISTNNILYGAVGDEIVTAKVRYAAKPAEARLAHLPDGRIKTTFVTPQRAVTPGQSIVFYKGDLVIGGGFIQ